MRQVALLFPGQGSQFVGMCSELIRNFKSANEHLNKIQNLIIKKKGPTDLLNTVLNGPSDQLKRTTYAQLSIFAVSSTFLLIGKELGKIPQRYPYCLGHSLGEITALYAANCITLEEAIDIIIVRSSHMENIKEKFTGMRAYLLHPQFSTHQVCQLIIQLSKNINEVVDIANINSKSQLVLSGSLNGLSYMTAYLNEHDIAVKGIDLPVSGPFHSRYMEDAKKPLLEKLKDIQFKSSPTQVISNVTALPYDDKNLLVDQLTNTVQWYDSIQYIKQQGIKSVIVLGPRRVLANLLKHEELDVMCISNMSDLVGKTSFE